MPLTDAEFTSILDDRTKRIQGDVCLEEGRGSLAGVGVPAQVESTSGWPLFVKGRYSSMAGTLNYALILKTAGRIYALDLGKDHHNPQCEQVGEKHKHRWSERYGDKEAYVPSDVNAPVSDPVAVWKEFCAEAGIQHDGRMKQPPPRQEKLW